MKATGIVRRVDELGRIVLPIELRRTLDITERDALEIYVRDLMLSGQAQALNLDRCEQITRQAAHINGLSMLRGVIRARERLRSNVGWNGVLDMICFDALEG